MSYKVTPQDVRDYLQKNPHKINTNGKSLEEGAADNRPIAGDPRLFIENLGYDIDTDSDQPDLWIWTTPSDGCEISFHTAKEALDSAWSDAVGQTMSINNLSSEQWDAMSFAKQKSSITEALTGDDGEESPMQDFTVIASDSDEGTLHVFHVEATDPYHAFGVVARNEAKEEGRRLDFLTALYGTHQEGKTFVLPGEGIVCAETVLEQPDIFGSGDEEQASVAPVPRD